MQVKMSELTIEEKVQQIKERANADENYSSRCLHCEEKVFFVEHTHALVPGHIYSNLGASEFRISQSCEYCFDDFTKEPDDYESELDVDDDGES